MQRYLTLIAGMSPSLASKLSGVLSRKRDGGGDVETFSVSGKEHEPWPIDPSSVEAGNPVALAVTYATSPDGYLSAGLWSCTAGRFRLKYGCDEVICIVDGEAIIHTEQGSKRLGAGDIAYFRHGLETTWEVPKSVRKVWVIRHAMNGALTRAARKATRLFRNIVFVLCAGSPQGLDALEIDREEVVRLLGEEVERVAA